MSEALEVRAEILKLSRLLERDPAELEYLSSVSPRDLRALREQIVEMLFTEHGQALSRVAASSRALPVALVAKIGEWAFGPVMSAHVAALLDPDRAVQMADRLPTPFLAEVAIEIDPRRTTQLIARIPPHRIADISRELSRRGEYVTLGRFVGHLGDQSLRAGIETVDDATLLQVAFVLEEKDSLDRLVSLLGNDRLDGLIDAAAAADLWPEALDLLSHLSPAHRAEFAERTASRDDAVIDSLLTAAVREDLWEALEPLNRALSEQGRRRFAERAQAVGLGDRLEELGLG